MIYRILLVLGKLIPGQTRRTQFIDWARSRFSVQAMMDSALATHLAEVEQAIYFHAHLFRSPTILSVDEALDALIDGRSIARFGDGELTTMEGRFDVFQVPSERLSRRLAEVLSSDAPGLLVGISSLAYDTRGDLTDAQKHFYAQNARWMREILTQHLQEGKIYAPTEVTLGHTIYRESYDRRSYFDRVRRIWEGASVVLIHGDGIFDGFTHDIFDNAASVEHILAPKQDAFDHYDDILQQALQAPQDSLIIAILGPTATVLAYDLHRAGYRALDLGHIAKSYDWWLNGRYGDEAEFFAAD